MSLRSRSGQVSLYLLALGGPCLMLLALLHQGLAILNYGYFRLAIMFLVLALSAGAAAYLAVRPGYAALRIAALGALIVNLGAIGLATTMWSAEMKRAFIETQMVPFEIDQVGILVCPADQSPREKEEARTLEDRMRAYVRGAHLSDEIGVRPCHPVATLKQAQTLGRDQRANVVVWKQVRSQRGRLYETHNVTIVGVEEGDLPLQPVPLMRALLMQVTVSLPATTGVEKPAPSAFLESAIIPAATGAAFYAAHQPALAATQFSKAYSAAGLPNLAATTLRNLYATTLLALERPDLAREAYIASNALQENSAAWVGQGVVAMQYRAWDEAAEWFVRAAIVDPYDARAYCGTGQVLATKRDVAAAQRALNQAIGLDPTNALPYAMLALVHELRADANSARLAYGLSSQYAGPSSGLARAVSSRSEQIRRNPPTPVPTATPRPTMSPTPIPTSAIYQVQKGDTIKSIADKFGVTVNGIVEINNLVDANSIDVGQTLLIPKVR